MKHLRRSGKSTQAALKIVLERWPRHATVYCGCDFDFDLDSTLEKVRMRRSPLSARQITLGSGQEGGGDPLGNAETALSRLPEHRPLPRLTRYTYGLFDGSVGVQNAL
jgi:hypothetical protein